jgi:hypothetical protein
MIVATIKAPYRHKSCSGFLVARGNSLSNLSKVVSGLKRRQNRRSTRKHPSSALSPRPRRRCNGCRRFFRHPWPTLAIHLQLFGHRSDIRHAGRFRYAGRRGACDIASAYASPHATMICGSKFTNAPWAPRRGSVSCHRRFYFQILRRQS